MTWFGWLLLGYWALNALLDICLIGKRFDLTPRVVAFQIVIWSLLAWGAVTVGTTS